VAKPYLPRKLPRTLKEMLRTQQRAGVGKEIGKAFIASSSKEKPLVIILEAEFYLSQCSSFPDMSSAMVGQSINVDGGGAFF